MARTFIHFFPHIHSFSMKVSLKAGDHLPITQQLDSLCEPLKGRRECVALLVKGKALVFKIHDPVSFVTLVSSFSFPLALPPTPCLPGFLRFFCCWSNCLCFLCLSPYSSSTPSCPFSFPLCISYTISRKASSKEWTDYKTLMVILSRLLLPHIF